MKQLKLKTLILDNSILELIYNINITMFEHEISNEILEDAVILKKNLNKNQYNYEIFRFHIKKKYKSWNKILTDKFKDLFINFDKAYKNYYVEKIEYEKYLNRFSTKFDEKNLFKFMEGLSLKPKKTISKN